MNIYGPKAGLHVTWLSKGYADKYTRRVHNVPEGYSLGWQPYTILIRSNGGTLAHCAFHRPRELRAWLGDSFKIKLAQYGGRGLRIGRVAAV